MKSKEAIARDQFSIEAFNRGDTNAATLGSENPDYFLKNRLEHAFLAGVESGKKIALDRITDHLKEIVQ